ncbi:uncharacterized protein LOC143046770 [Mytilus galloprovincialis]|uniref:uncharacterized protein LOC143046770 n=1 Tax=Mytilus galloprovincialis TaxID=29158 RepID=UPI003F7B580C
MSAEICFKICTESQNWKEHVYFGTQYAKECYCGNGTELGHEPYVKRETECTTPCLKHEGETCGGNYRMSVYQMTKRHYKYSCLDMYQDHAIEECAANHLQIESLCIKFDDSLENENLGCSDMGNKLYDFCRRQHPNRKCDFNMKNFTKATNENQPSRSISIEYLCKEQNLARSSTKSRLTTGTVVGTVVGSVLFLCLVFIGIFIGRRFLFCDKLNKKLKNNPETNDYVGNQNIALPQAVRPTTRNVQYEDLQNTSGNISTHNYSCTNVHSQNINDKYGYAKNIEKNKSKTFNDTTSTPTYVVLKNDSYNPNLDANNDEYAVVDPTAEPSFKHAQNNTTPGPENYMILDPSQTGFNRTKFPNDDQAYKLANYISDTRSHKYDVYALSPEGTYDHSGITRHRKDQDTIYTHTVDNVYDSASRGVNIARKEDTYDHFFGKRTEDEYNIAMH